MLNVLNMPYRPTTNIMQRGQLASHMQQLNLVAAQPYAVPSHKTDLEPLSVRNFENERLD